VRTEFLPKFLGLPDPKNNIDSAFANTFGFVVRLKACLFAMVICGKTLYTRDSAPLYNLLQYLVSSLIINILVDLQ